MAKLKYTTQPVADPEYQERLRWVMAALAGQVTVAEAARQLSLSRVQMHNLINRMAIGMRAAIMPQAAGRPAQSARERELEESNQRLERENQRLRQRVETVDRLLGVASEMMKGRIQARGRTPKRSGGSCATSKRDSEEPEGCREWLDGVRTMRGCGLSASLAAAVAGISAATLRRWQHQLGQGLPPRAQRGGGPKSLCKPSAAVAVAQRVRDLHGLIGANSLRSCEISRRQALRVKRETLTTMERERKTQCAHVHVSAPAVMRGFDAMYVGDRYALIAADAALPFRTSAVATEHYDTNSVLRALEIDFSNHDIPLVLRLDRAACHREKRISDFLAYHGVLALHGPPHHPRYYGQLERQNREHRQWLRFAEADLDLQVTLDEMVLALNTKWPRPTLGRRTAAQLWDERPVIHVDRKMLHEEVMERATRIAMEIDSTVREPIADLAWRLSVEHALTSRGFLTVTRPEGVK